LTSLYKYTSKYAKQFLTNTLSRDSLQFLIFFVTSAWNCRCSTCFNWRNLNKSSDLSLDEIKKISGNLGDFHTLLLSGGEPFLRDDLLDVCRLFMGQNRISVLAVPTNGTFPDRVEAFAETLLKEYPDTLLFFLISLDGFEKTHDAVKGVTGVFARAMETLNKLKRLKARYRNLELVIGTVITDRNAKELNAFMDFVYDELDVN
jgi:MoaA/NifB/PqqE/SkfB family radical SAM enzyme